MTAKKILIVSQSHLCRNPRVLKEAIALTKAGYKISVLTAIYSDDLYHEDLSLLKGTEIGYQIYSDLRYRNWSSLKARLIRKIALIAQLHLGIESIYSLGYHISNLKKLLAASTADLYIMHQEVATVAGSTMADNYKVAFDIEDWYSEDLLPHARKGRPTRILKRAERLAIEKGVLCYTTSCSMAKGMKAFYKAINEPEVIYNSFHANNSIVGSKSPEILALYWLSQTIGEGRGLEFFIGCMAKSSIKCQLTLRGNVSDAYKNALSALLSPKDSIEFLPMLNNNEIQADMARYDAGLALEPDVPLNKDLTISNKLFHYMASGLPVIASCTKGQAEIAEQCPHLIFTYRQNMADDLVAILNNLGAIKRTNELMALKNKVLEFYKGHFAWPAEAVKLVNLIKSVFETAS